MYLPDIDAALHEAENSAREILADMLRDGTPLDGQAIEVTTEDGTVVRRVPFKSGFWVGA